MLRRLFLAISFLFLASLAHAQAPAGLPAGAAPARVDPEQMRQEMTLVEAALQRDALSESELERLRQRMQPLLANVQAIITREQPRLEEVDARLAQIGPAPKEGQPAESADVAKSRAEQEALKKEIDDTIRVARLIQVRIEQAATAITDYRRRLFAREVLHRTQSIASPWLWAQALQAIPNAASAFSALVQFRFRHALNNLDGFNLAAAIGLVLLLLVAYAPARRLLLTRLDAWTVPGDGLPTRGQKAIGALRGTLLRTVLPLVIAIVLSVILGMIGFGNDRLGEFIKAVLFSFAILAFLRGLLVGILQPKRPAWRVAHVEQRTAEILFPSLWSVILVVFGGKVLEAATQSIAGALPITYALKGTTALATALALGAGLRKLDAHREQQAQALDEFGPEVAANAGHTLAIVLKVIGWIAAMIVVGAALLGYISLAAFMMDQLLWLLSVAAFLALILIVVDEYVAKGTTGDNALVRRIRAATGVPPQSIQQAGIIASGLIRLLIYAVGALLVLASFGVNSGDLFGSVQAAMFGFQVAGVTVSISKILTAVLTFAGVYLVFRGIQRWVEKVWLPSTSLDAGLQNSIVTVIGYAGFLSAVGIAMVYFGLSLDKIAIVAGALSVGIGLGLQSIVNNFVSGLILLWERPIKVGDLIVVGTETGRVRRINVRSTEILTGDQASLIVPNSEFISGRVKNLMFANRVARVLVPVSVAPGADPEMVRQALLEVANSHREVTTSPPANVIFLNVTATSLDFELSCFTDVDSQGAVRSDLMFELFSRLKKLAIIVPPPKEPAAVGDIKTLMAALVDKRRDPAG